MVKNFALQFHMLFQILSGASLLIYPFLAVDAIANTSEEQKNPLRNSPALFTIVVSLTVISTVAVSVALTLMSPSHSFSDIAGVSVIFENRNIQGARYVFGVGALIFLFASTTSFLFTIPRILYALSRDGLLPECVDRRFDIKRPYPCESVSTFILFVVHSYSLLQNEHTVVYARHGHLADVFPSVPVCFKFTLPTVQRRNGTGIRRSQRGRVHHGVFLPVLRQQTISSWSRRCSFL